MDWIPPNQIGGARHNNSSPSSSSSPSKLLGLIKSGATTLVGFLRVDSKQACRKECYLGLHELSSSSSTSSNPPIIDLKSIDISNVNNLDEFDLSFLNSLWLKSLSRTLPPKTFDLDAKLVKLFSNRFESLRRWNNWNDSIETKFKLNIERTTSSKKTVNENLGLAYEIRLNFTWPHFLPDQTLHMPPTQMIEQRTAELTVTNPSNATVLVQLGLLNGYASRDQLNELVAQHANLFRQPELFATSFKFGEQSAAARAVYSASTAFSLSTPLSTAHDATAATNRLQFTLGPRQSAGFQLRFRPQQLGIHENVLVVRNNLTILDAYHVLGAAASAELRLEGLEPAKTSVLLNEPEQQASRGLDLAEDSTLGIVMTEREFELCKLDTTPRHDSKLD